jgi:single-strand DNA-binding protein
MANFNKVILVGNLTRDVEMRYTQGGLAIGKMGMAVNRRYKQGEEQKESTCFVDLTAFGKQAEVLSQYVSKGSPLFVEGRLEYSTWEAKEGGGKRNKLEVIIENFQFLGGRSGGRGGQEEESGGAKPAAGKTAAAGGEQVDYGDIPF